MRKITFSLLPIIGMIVLSGAVNYPDAKSFVPSTSPAGSPHATNKKPVIIWQPSHQTDTGKDFSEAGVCNGIVEAAMKAEPNLKEYKVWSLGRKVFIMRMLAVIQL